MRTMKKQQFNYFPNGLRKNWFALILWKFAMLLGWDFRPTLCLLKSFKFLPTFVRMSISCHCVKYDIIAKRHKICLMHYQLFGSVPKYDNFIPPFWMPQWFETENNGCYLLYANSSSNCTGYWMFVQGIACQRHTYILNTRKTSVGQWIHFYCLWINSCCWLFSCDKLTFDTSVMPDWTSWR